MKTSCTNTLTSIGSRLGKTLILSLSVALLCLATTSKAAVTPISVTSAGIGPITFDTLPGLADGWSTRNAGGGNANPNTLAGLDPDVQTNDVSFIVTALGTDSTVTNSTTMFGSAGTAGGTSANFRWNSNGRFIGSRPTGNSYCMLMATLANSSGANQTNVVVHYDYGLDLVSGTSSSEDESGNLGGLKLYYSLSGAANSWVRVAAVEVNQTTTFSTNLTGRIDLSATPWNTGASLYLLWVDDDAVTGSTGTTGTVEQPNAFDNFSLDFGVCATPVISTQPGAVTVDNCTSTNLHVVAEGTGATFQWFHDGNMISGATGPTLPLNNVDGTANGQYFVRVTACAQTVESDHVQVTVNDTPTTITSALLACDLITITINFSHSLTVNTVNDGTVYQAHPLSGGADTVGTTAVVSTGADGLSNVVTLTLSAPLTAGQNYELLMQQGGNDCAGNQIQPVDQGDFFVHAPMNYDVCLLSMTTTEWRINTNGVSQGTDWRSDPTYDDSAWPTGVGAFDAKNGTTRPTIGGVTVNTHLPLTDPNWSATDDIPVYYFRTHFTVPTSPTDIVSLHLFTLSDDFDVAWLNNMETPIHIRPGFPAGTNVDQFYYGGGTAVGDAAVEGPFNLSPTLLNYGDNLMTAKIFQANMGSSDITFAYTLVARVTQFRVPVTLSIAINGSTVTVTWTDGTKNLYTSDVADAPANSWVALPGGTPNYNAGSYSFGLGSAAAKKFYTLRQ